MEWWVNVPSGYNDSYYFRRVFQRIIELFSNIINNIANNPFLRVFALLALFMVAVAILQGLLKRRF